MMKALKQKTALAILAGLLVALPAAANNGNPNLVLPGFLSLADNGYLVVFSAGDFSSCSVVFCNSSGGPFPGGDLMHNCVAVGAPDIEPHWFFTGSGANQVQIGGRLWTRVYAYDNPDELTSFAGDPCSFIASEVPVAQGMTRTKWTSNDDGSIGPGASSSSLTSNGFIESVSVCTSGAAVRFKLSRTWIYFLDEENFDYQAMVLRSAKGPSLTCVD